MAYLIPKKNTILTMTVLVTAATSGAIPQPQGCRCDSTSPEFLSSGHREPTWINGEQPMGCVGGSRFW